MGRIAKVTVNNGINGNSHPRVSDYVKSYVTPKQKKAWNEKCKAAAIIDGIRNPDNGTFLGRIADSDLKLDLASLRLYAELTPPDPPRRRGA